MVVGEVVKVIGFRKSFDIYKLLRFVDRFIVGEIEREFKDNFWVFGFSN